MLLDDDGIRENAPFLLLDAATTFWVFIEEGEARFRAAGALGEAASRVLDRKHLSVKTVVRFKGDGHAGGRAYQAD